DSARPDDPQDRLPRRGATRRPAGGAARRAAHRRHADGRPGRLPLDPLGAAGRRADAAADPAQRARRRAPWCLHRDRLGHRGRVGGRGLGTAGGGRGHLPASGRRAGGAGERAAVPLRAPDQRCARHRRADRRLAPGGAALVAGPSRRAPQLAPPGPRRRGAGPGAGPVRHRARAGRRGGVQLRQRPLPARLRLRGHRHHPDDGRRASAVGARAAASAPVPRL
ncbi:MAG: GCN5-related N-acetyltransferase, partial [uncultured Blastococcus sp.]